MRQARAVSGRSAAAYCSTSTRPSRSTGTDVAGAPVWSTACSTQECSTAECTRCRPVRDRPPAAPRTPRCAASVPDGGNDTSSGRAPTTAATASRAPSSSRRARRPAPYSLVGSAHPSSSAASSAAACCGCSGQCRRRRRGALRRGGHDGDRTSASPGRNVRSAGLRSVSGQPGPQTALWSRLPSACQEGPKVEPHPQPTVAGRRAPRPVAPCAGAAARRAAGPAAPPSVAVTSTRTASRWGSRSR